MSEAASALVNPKPRGGETVQLVALLEAGQSKEADILTAEMAAETATWFDVPGCKWTTEQIAGRIKQFWLGEYKRVLSEEEAEYAEEIWAGAVARKREALEAKAKREVKAVTHRELKAAMDTEAKAKVAPPKADPLFSAVAQPEVVEAKSEVEEPVDEPKALVPAEPNAVALVRPKSLCAPGLLGEIADFALRAMMYPSEKFAVAMAIGIKCTLISRRIAGPSGPRGTGTHTYQGIVGPTGIGKETLRTIGNLLMTTAGAAALIGPGEVQIRGRHREVSSENAGCGVLR